MKNSILNLTNVSELSSEIKKKISGGTAPVQIAGVTYCCFNSAGDRVNFTDDCPSEVGSNFHLICPETFKGPRFIGSGPLSGIKW